MSFSRRPGQRFNRGRIATAAPAAAAPVTPLTILGSLAWWVRADLGITIGTGVSAWADQSGNAVNFTQGTGASQPTLVASAINGKPAVQFDGVDDRMNATFARVAPGTQPFYLWLVMKQIAWTAGVRIIGDFVVNGCFLLQNSASPQIAQFNAATANSGGGATVGSYFRVESQFSNSTSDYIKKGSTNTTGANAGNGAGGGTWQLGARGDSAGSPANVEIAEAFLFLGTPTAQNRTDLDAYCTARYGAGLV